MDAVDQSLLPAGAGLESDPDVREAVKQLALHTIEITEEILDSAAPQQQLQMIRILMPRIVSSIGKETGEEDEAMKAAVQSLYDNIMEQTGGHDGDG